VGEYQEAGGFYKTLIERWDGVSWSIVNSPSVDGNTYNFLTAVTCANSTTCFAVGQYNGVSTPTFTLTLLWNGVKWSIIPSPNATEDDYNILNGVDCIAPDNCYAVGYYLNGSPERELTLILQWNAYSWTMVPSANTPTTQDNNLNSISCTSASDCWAVGIFHGGPDQGTIIEHWNGMAWAIVPSPAPISATDSLNGVSCVSTANCWAVGATGNPSQPLIGHWNGMAWSIFTGPSLQLTGITHPSGSVFGIDGLGPVSSQINILATPNLNQQFMSIGSAMSDMNGSFHYEEMVAPGTPQRFYRASTP